jgi:hypothetical protein
MRFRIVCFGDDAVVVVEDGKITAVGKDGTLPQHPFKEACGSR